MAAPAVHHPGALAARRRARLDRTATRAGRRQAAAHGPRLSFRRIAMRTPRRRGGEPLRLGGPALLAVAARLAERQSIGLGKRVLVRVYVGGQCMCKNNTTCTK